MPLTTEHIIDVFCLRVNLAQKFKALEARRHTHIVKKEEWEKLSELYTFLWLLDQATTQLTSTDSLVTEADACKLYRYLKTAIYVKPATYTLVRVSTCPEGSC